MPWEFPIIRAVRERIRARTPGELPPMDMSHPIIGLIHDVQRFIRRRVFGGRRSTYS